MRYAVLGSGSSGNATVIESGNTCILIDAGLSAKQLTLRLRARGVDPDSISGIVITHEHQDHIGGLRVFLKKRKIPVYTTATTAQILRENHPDLHLKLFESGNRFNLGDLEIQSFHVPHDAVDPLGFAVHSQHYCMGVVTDTGQTTEQMVHHLQAAQSLFIEANYCQSLLESDRNRPWSIKQRIASHHGHLSNTQAAEFVALLAARKQLRHVVLGHLSRQCNRPDTAMTTVSQAVRTAMGYTIPISCVEQDTPSPWHRLDTTNRELTSANGTS